jgi:hypothetical protein
MITYTKKGYEFKLDLEEARIDGDCLALKVTYKDDWGFGIFISKKNTIEFYSKLKVGKMYIKGIEIDDQNIINTLNELQKKLIEERRKEIEKVKTFVPKKIRFALGGDSWRVYVATDEIQTRLGVPEIVEKVEFLMNRYRKETLNEITSKSKKIDINVGYTVDGWREIELATVLKILQPVAEKSEKEKEERRKAKAEKERMAFEEAKATGKPVLLSSYPTDCDGSEEGCDVDIVSIYAMPDGNVKEERVHTY